MGAVVLTPSGLDDTAAIQAALATHRIVRLGEGDFLATGDLVIGQQRAKLISEDGATLTFTTPDRPGVTLAGWLNEVEIAGISIGRNVTAVHGAVGIDTSAVSCDYAHFHDLTIRDQHRGMKLGVTAWSHVEKVVIERSVSDGLMLINGAPGGTLQWQLDDILSARNGIRGFFVLTQPTSPQVTMGNWSRIATWANSGVGAAFVGSAACPLQGVRITDGFLGGDGNHECFFDTYGGLHVISNLFVELAGKGLTGPARTTPASNIGYGLYVTPNNGSLHAVNLRASGNSLGSYVLSNAQQRLRESVDGAGSLVNVAGPAVIA